MPYMAAIKTKVTTEFSTTTAHKIFRTGYGPNAENSLSVYASNCEKNGNDGYGNAAKTICEFSSFDIEMYDVNPLSSIALACIRNFYNL